VSRSSWSASPAGRRPGWGADQRAERHDARVVHQQVDIPALPGDPRNVSRIGDVECDGHDPGLAASLAEARAQMGRLPFVALGLMTFEYTELTKL
jgi:hypothetical protein